MAKQLSLVEFTLVAPGYVRWGWFNIRRTIRLGQEINCVLKQSAVAVRNAVNFYSTTADVCQYMYMHKYMKFMRVKDDQLVTVSGHGFVNKPSWPY